MTKYPQYFMNKSFGGLAVNVIFGTNYNVVVIKL